MPPSGSRRSIRGGPVFDLAVLKGMVAAGAMTENEVWVATDRCERDLENEQWTYGDVLHLLSCLTPSNFKNSEWCQVKGGEVFPCDAYSLRFDFERRTSNARGVEVYMKFSVDDRGQLSLVLVSCHGSR
jgi:hypothetical protein